MASTEVTEKPTIVDRGVGGLLAALTVAVMIILGPIIAFFVTGLRGMYVNGMSNVFDIYSRVLTWGPALVGAAAIVGGVLGTRGVASLFGYLWGTEEPKRPFLTAMLWLALAAIGVLSVVATSGSHAH